MEFPQLSVNLGDLVDAHIGGCPMNGIRWTYLQSSELQRELASSQGFKVSAPVINRLLKSMGLGRRQLVKKTTYGSVSGRNEQFEWINKRKKYYLSQGWALLSIDVKKKELMGRFYRQGKSWSSAPRSCFDHDFDHYASATVVPHGIYDLTHNQGYITLSESKDTAAFNVACLSQYWQELGKVAFPKGPILLLLDSGGSNSCIYHQFKWQLQQWANQIGRVIEVCHYPTYCSKYNPIEHRLFPAITRAWTGVILDRIDTMKALIELRCKDLASGLKVRVCQMKQKFEQAKTLAKDWRDYCLIEFAQTNPKWNYSIRPVSKSDNY